MKKLLKYTFLLILITQCSPFGGWGNVYAQLYPVQLTPVFKSPYSVKISDYATSMDTKFQLLINPTDITISQRQVRLKLYIQGNGVNIRSSDYITGQRPIFINGGEFQTLTNTDISALFRLENLQGITPLQYANPLPDGMYDFCFEMYDYITNQKISQKSCASIYLLLNDPPLLNTPQKNEQIAASDFPNIMFTWTPRQMNATNVSYKFELKQLIDPTLDPQFAFQMSPLLYEETVFSTAMLYNLSMPILTPGMRYAWRVRAISTTGLSENAIFKNDGYSEIYSFKYTASCAAPTFLLSEAQSPTSVKITWQGIPDHTKYQLQYNKQDVRNAQWFSTNSLNTQSLITNLEPGVTYQFRVGSSCDPATEGIQSFTYSAISTFTTPTQANGVPAYNCGIIPNINIQNQKPLTNLIQTETFTAGDFPVTVLELKGENSPYSGRGYIIVPYLADTKIAVEFNNITINTDYQLINGIVETSYNPDWKNVANVEDFTGEGASGKIKEEVPFEIDKIVVDANGNIVVNGKNGEQVTIPGGKDTVITDSSGNIYNVDKDGNGSNIPTEPAIGGKSTPANTDGVDKNGQVTEFTAKGISIVFSNNEDLKNGAISKYAFDVMPDTKSTFLEKLYKKAGNAVLPYKAVINGNSDTLLATVNLTDTTIKLDSIVFKTESGGKIDFVLKDKTFTLTVKGKLAYAEEQILATIKQGDKWKVIGAFMMVHISPKEVNVLLVPLNKEAQIPSTAEKDIAAIYEKVGVKLNISRTSKIDYADADGKIEVGNSDFFDTYTVEEKTINGLIKNSNNYKTDTYYLVYSDLPASNPDVQGFMALNGQFGYVFSNSSPKIVSHELGHGIFGLEHPFTNKTEQGKTDFLMDKGNGVNLWHNDWKQINDPKFKLYLFQNDKEGELLSSILIDISNYEQNDYEQNDYDYDDLTPDSYFNLGKVDVFGGGDRIVIKDDTGRVIDLFTSPNYDFATWQKIKKRFWIYVQEKSNGSWQWDETYQSYTQGNEKKDNNWYGAVGTLTMIINPKKIYLSFDKFTLNMMGSIYIGPNNPKKLDGTDDYSKEPQDLTDAAARAHDKGYDKVGATGINGATKDVRTIEADIHLVRGSRKIKKMYAEKLIDPYTLNPISKETFKRAKNIDNLFTLLVRSKILEIGKEITPEKQRLLDKLDDFVNITIDDIINPVDIKGKKTKLY
ncbi:Fibronectin type III domain protein [Flavobacterium sp. ACN2]|uniref:fibronectin type III domain-containing protein n=1 Tax=Flavobacterium sp. ACN2 TaxID=1975676 RepID=UPI000BB3832C|nr:fibronectin type III domain-containing protein [Flavobacterium sp. ACN2]PBI84690.1 Fibronectin type III domain protein [Flavobacterium sp. ACN2]